MRIDWISIKRREPMQLRGKIVEPRYYYYQTCKGGTVACSACFHGLYTLNRRLYYWWFIALESTDGRWYHGAPLVHRHTCAYSIDENMRNYLSATRNYFSILGRNYRTAFIILSEARSNIVKSKSKKVSICFMWDTVGYFLMKFWWKTMRDA